MIWRTNRRTFDLGQRGAIVGILNVTPDSFSDGGRYLDTGTAVTHALRMIEEGAEIIDVGGESTRPGAAAVTTDDEIARVIPVIEMLRAKTAAAISVDTSKSAVARAALDAGAEIINDVTALTGDPQMAAVVAEAGAGVVLMHMRGNPRNMQKNTSYAHVVTEVANYLSQRAQAANAAGVAEECLAIDPGIGFGKTAVQNWALIDAVRIFATIGPPVMLGVSRKSFLADEAGDDMDQRDAVTARLTALGFTLGARLFRVHEIPENLAALRIAEQVARETRG